jgi:hypothetical protein
LDGPVLKPIPGQRSGAFALRTSRRPEDTQKKARCVEAPG